jgi:hypothetical protein
MLAHQSLQLLLVNTIPTAENEATVKSDHEYYDENEGYLEEPEFGRSVVKAIA